MRVSADIRFLVAYIVCVQLFVFQPGVPVAYSGHKYNKHLTTSHLGSPYIELICVDVEASQSFPDGGRAFVSDATSKILDTLLAPGVGWQGRPDSRIDIYGLLNPSEGRWVMCNELDPNYRAKNVRIEYLVRIGGSAYCLNHPALPVVSGCTEEAPGFEIVGAHPPATNLCDFTKFLVNI